MSLLQQAPRFTVEDAAALVRARYDLDAAAAPLPSERDQNFRIRARDGAEFVLKIANATESLELLAAQNAAMTHAAAGARCPRVVPDVGGAAISTIEASGGAIHFVRLVTWLAGVPLGTVADHSADLLEDLGRAIGELGCALASFDHPAIHREFYWDLANGPSIVRDRAALITSRSLRDDVEAVAWQFARRASPVLDVLPKSAIHNDANDHNVIIDAGRVVGVIDFGDMVYGWTAGDLAIAIAYAVLDKRDPSSAAAAVIRGYTLVKPLTDVERGVLFDLVRMRLAMSVCIAAAQHAERPDDEYLTISQAPIRATLPMLMQL